MEMLIKAKISKLTPEEDEDKIYADIEIAKNKKEKQIKSPYRDYINFIYTREDEKQWIPVQKQ